MVVMMAAVFSMKNKLNECIGAHGVVVSHPLRMRKALSSNPSVSVLWALAHHCVAHVLSYILYAGPLD